MRNSKQLKFTKKEQKQNSLLVNGLSSILLEKMDRGVNSPELTGTVKVDDDIQVVFSIHAYRIKNVLK